MRNRLKRTVILLLAAALALLLLFLPGLPWSARNSHTLRRAVVKAEMKLAGWRGHSPRLVSISGRINAAGAEVQALDSRSGWASLADGEGNFVLRDVIWYPNARYDLAISSDEKTGRMIVVRAPEESPANASFSVGALDLNTGDSVELGSLMGISSITEEDLDVKNAEYYKDAFDKAASGTQSDEERVAAINDFVSTKLNYNETEREPGTPRLVLERGSQFCGLLSNAMRTLLATGGYRSRAVNIIDDNNPPGTHVAVEVFYGGEWHLYDPTFGVKFLRKDGQVASYRDVRLDTSLITEALFSKFEPRFRREVLALLLDAYKTGWHHYYYFKSDR